MTRNANQLRRIGLIALALSTPLLFAPSVHADGSGAVLVEDTTESPLTPKLDGRAPLDNPFHYAIGDKVRVTFFEQLDLPAEQGSAQTAALRTLYQRVDLTAEYTVEADGSIGLPRLGRIVFAGRGEEVVRIDILSRYEEQMGRAGDVHIAIIERQPVYVVGPVRAPGAYRFTAGMVAIQAIALAGGLEMGRERLDPLTQARRESERSDQAAVRLAGLLARKAMLEAEQDGRKPVPPADLVALVGEADAQNMIDVELRAAAAADTARKTETDRHEATILAAKREIASMEDSAERVSREINERLALIAHATQPDPRLTDKETVGRLRTEIADLELRLQQFQAAIQRINQDIARETAARDRIQQDYSTLAARDIVATMNEIVAMKQTIHGAERTAGTIYGAVGPSDVSAHGIEIVRTTLSGPVTFAADETTSLRPGDVVRLHQARAAKRVEIPAASGLLQ